MGLPSQAEDGGAPARGARYAEATRPSAGARNFFESPNPERSIALLAQINATAPRGAPCRPDPARPLVLYGAGNLGKLARSHLDAVGQPIAYVVDANATAYRNDPDWAGLKIVPPDAVGVQDKAAALLAVSIVNTPFAPLKAHLSEAGWRNPVPFYDIAESFRDRHPLSNGWFAAPLTADELADLEDVLSTWSDDASRAHHLRFAAWRLAREEWDFADAPVVPAERFFVTPVMAALGRGVRFLDAGAHNGSVSERLLQERRGDIGALWTIEPDDANRAALHHWAETLGAGMRQRLSILDAVVTAREEAVRFHQGLGFASQIAESGQAGRRGTPIDALGLDPTFIKLHLEGGERAALLGATGTLRRHRPVLALTVYHNADGLSRTAKWLMETLERYVFLMRTHSWCGTGAVIYAIPKERYCA